jgi:hypothetical protein
MLNTQPTTKSGDPCGEPLQMLRHPTDTSERGCLDAGVGTETLRRRDDLTLWSMRPWRGSRHQRE